MSTRYKPDTTSVSRSILLHGLSRSGRKLAYQRDYDSGHIAKCEVSVLWASNTISVRNGGRSFARPAVTNEGTNQKLLLSSVPNHPWHRDSIGAIIRFKMEGLDNAKSLTVKKVRITG